MATEHHGGGSYTEFWPPVLHCMSIQESIGVGMSSGHSKHNVGWLHSTAHVFGRESSDNGKVGSSPVETERRINEIGRTEKEVEVSSSTIRSIINLLKILPYIGLFAPLALLIDHAFVNFFPVSIQIICHVS